MRKKKYPAKIIQFPTKQQRQPESQIVKLYLQLNSRLVYFGDYPLEELEKLKSLVNTFKAKTS